MTPDEKLKKDMDELTKALTLTPDQAVKIKPLVKEANEKQAELAVQMNKSDGQVKLASLQEESKKITTDLDAKIGAVITKQQLVKLQAFRPK